jgi:heat shock protein HslJ
MRGRTTVETRRRQVLEGRYIRRTITAAAIAAILFSVAACTASGGTGGTIDGTSWALKTYDVSGTATLVPAGTRVDANFAGGKVSGFSGCNLYNAPVTTSGATIKVGHAATTAMACDAAKTALEQAYLANLAKAATFTATRDALTMYDSGGKSILVYAAAAANPLEGSWDVTGYNNGKQAVVSPVAGSKLTAIFTADQVSGSAGCNTYSGSYTLDGTTLKIGPLASTMRACADQAVNDQEQQFLAAMQNATTFSQTGNVMTLQAAGGENQVTLVPTP